MFTGKTRFLLKRLLLVFTIIVSILLALSWLSPYIKPGQFWFLSIPSLFFPYLLLTESLLLLSWIFIRSKWGLLCLVMILGSWSIVRLTVGFNLPAEANQETTREGDLRLMNWNVLNWDQMNGTNDGRVSYRSLMMDAISQQGADVLCLQEFFEPVNTAHFQSNLKAMADRGYVYQYFYPSNSIWENAALFGMAILSRFPIIDTGFVSFGKTPHSEGLMYADIQLKNKVIRLFSIHLESFRIGNQGGGHNYGLAGHARGLLSGMRNAYHYRTAQVRLVTEEIGKSPHPVIISGNLGDVPGSYAYHQVRNNLNDAFLERGAGFGATIKFVSPTLRVDYILSDPGIKVLQYYGPKLPYSDHYPVIVDFKL